ncbi:hypothetical protein [Streptomyces sp. cg40]|uniref:hypothetical protein n=1 Tax=Streptomyces sp. cg40 TaxID=3419764 RepID=UPI003CFE4487
MCRVDSSTLDGREFTTTPIRFEHLSTIAIALVSGPALATVLAVPGLLGRPVPVIVPMRAGRGGRSWRWVLGILLVLLAAALGVLIPVAFLLPVQVSIVCGVAGGLGAALAVRRYPGVAGHAQGRDAPTRGPRGPRPFGVPGRAMARGLAAGLLRGMVFGTALAVTLAGRSAASPESPPGGVWDVNTDRRSVLVTPDGWKHARLPDGTRVAIAAAATDWRVDRRSDGSVYAQTLDEPCDAWCETFHSPVELELRPGDEDLLVKLPGGTFAESFDPENAMPLAAGEWLLRGTPGVLFGGALLTGLSFGLSLGLVGGATAALHGRLVTPTEVTQVGTPLDGLRADRATAVSRVVLLALFGAVGATLTLLVTIPAPLAWLTTGGDMVTFSGFVLVAVAPLALALSAWGWFLVTRLWLCGTGRLPWRLMGFLDGAHRRGVLRQIGAVYEFRHARLQERLAAWPISDRPA